MTDSKVLTTMSLAMVGLLQRIAQGPVASNEVHGPLLKGLMTRGLATHHNGRAFLTWAGHKVITQLEEIND